jgi:hypothetical protein
VAAALPAALRAGYAQATAEAAHAR